jgi:hypothetical protein
MDSDKLAEQNFSVCCGQVAERQLRFGLMQDHMQSLDFDITNFILRLKTNLCMECMYHSLFSHEEFFKTEVLHKWAVKCFSI